MAVRDTLLRAAEAGLVQPYWSARVLEEMRRNLVKQGQCSEQQADTLVIIINRVFPDSTVTGYEHLELTMKNDPGDRHVVAAALMANAQVIVTNNLKHFRKKDLPPSMEAQSADDFLQHLFDLSPRRMLEVLRKQASDKKKPPLTLGAASRRSGQVGARLHQGRPRLPGPARRRAQWQRLKLPVHQPDSIPAGRSSPEKRHRGSGQGANLTRGVQRYRTAKKCARGPGGGGPDPRSASSTGAPESWKASSGAHKARGVPTLWGRVGAFWKTSDGLARQAGVSNLASEDQAGVSKTKRSGWAPPEGEPGSGPLEGGSEEERTRKAGKGEVG